MKQNLPEFLVQAIRYFGSFMFIFGIVSGILNCVVLNQPKMRKSKIRFYLLAQSINDILVLGISLPDFVLRHAFQIDLHRTSPFLCKFWPFLERSLRQLSSWIVVGISAERLAGCLISMFYFKSRHKHRPISFVIALFLFAGSNSPMFYYHKLIFYEPLAEMNSTGSGNRTENEVVDRIHHLPSFPTMVCVSEKEYYPASISVFYLIDWFFPLLILTGTIMYFAKWLHNRQCWKNKNLDMRITVPNSKSGLKQNFKESLNTLFILNCFFFICFTPLAICELWQLTQTNSPITLRTTNSSQQVYPIAEALPASCVALQLFSYFFYATKFVFFICMLTSFRKDFVNFRKKCHRSLYRDQLQSR